MVAVGYLIAAADLASAQDPINDNPLRGASTAVTETVAAATPDAAASAAPPTVEDNSDGDDEAEPKGPRLTPPDPAERKAIEDRLHALDGAGLSDEDKKRTVDYYQQALKSLDVAVQQIDAAHRFEEQLKLTQTGRYSTASYAEKLVKPLPPYEDVAGLALAEIEKRATVAEASLAHCREELAAMVAEPKRRSQRLAELPGQIAEAQQRLKQTTDDLAALGSEDAADIVSNARRAALTHVLAECKATLYAQEREQKLYQESGDWVTTRRDYYARYVPHKEKRLAQLRAIITRLREDETRAQARLAAQAAERAVQVKKPKQIIDLANENRQLADERTKLVAAMNDVKKSNDATLAMFVQLDTQFTNAQKRAEKISNAAGQLLRDQQAKLPDLVDLERKYAAREPLLSEVLLRSYALQDDSSELANLDELTDRLAAAAGDPRGAFRDELRALLATKRETLDLLIADYMTYSTDLNALHSEQAKLIALVEEYADFIAERVLWIRSCAPPSLSDWRHAAHALAWSLDPRHLRDAGAAVLHAGSRRPALFILFVVGVATLGFAQRSVRTNLREVGTEAKKRNCSSLRPTFHAFWLTTVLALPWPAALLFAGWTMDSLSETEYVRAFGAGLRFVAVCLLLIELSRHLCRQNGLADAHFDWPDKCLHRVRRKLRWLATLGLPPVMWLAGLEAQRVEPFWSSSLGRALFIGVMLLLATILHRILLAANSPFRQVVIISGGWLTPVQIVWRPAIVILPAALAVLAAVGFYYTAQQAALRFLQTIGLLLAMLTLGGVTRRWLLVSRRRLAREQAKQRRAQLAAAADDDPSSLTAADLVDDNVDLAALSEQTRKLVRAFLALTLTVGLVLIWGEILPALKYPAKHLLPGAAERTWGDLATFVLVLAITYISVRDVPALLELVILQHLPLDSGSRYAFTSMSRYVLTAIGLSAAFNSIGGEWAKIQWLVAAMSVGLGFGLQEIFANFVSGIILLFERPIRVGDIVTLGDKTGVVNRIRMRATTIVDPDRKEYIVPNKDLVTERLLNWTLTDYTNRVEVIVNVASGSDTDLACTLLLESAAEQPHVLREPTPSATFEGFTETGLKLALRCFLPNLDNRGSTIHALHTAIDRKLRAAGIESAYGDMRVRLTREVAHAMQASPPAAIRAPLERARRTANSDRGNAA